LKFLTNRLVVTTNEKIEVCFEIYKIEKFWREKLRKFEGITKKNESINFSVIVHFISAMFWK